MEVKEVAVQAPGSVPILLRMGARLERSLSSWCLTNELTKRRKYLVVSHPGRQFIQNSIRDSIIDLKINYG